MSPSNTIAIAPELLRETADRVTARCDLLAQHSETPNALTRTFCSDAMKSAHDELRHWMELTGMNCRLDAVGNLVGHYPTGPQDPSQRKTS